MTTPLLYADLERDEGLRLTAYEDTRGRMTIGYGHAEGVTPGMTWTLQEARDVLYADVAAAEGQLSRAYPWWRSLDDVRQDALVELCYNMGIGTLAGFTNTLAAVRAANWQRAAEGLISSKWATEVGQRAVRLAFMMRTGERP